MLTSNIWREGGGGGGGGGLNKGDYGQLKNCKYHSKRILSDISHVA